MRIIRLALADFRSYREAVLEPGPGFVVLTGENGAGKTNILEAVSLLAPGRGLRRAKLSDMARKRGPGNFAISARLASPLSLAGGAGATVWSADQLDTRTANRSRLREGDITIGTGTTPEAPERRRVRINGADAPATALAEWLSILWLTPAMDRIFADTPGARRQFLDRLTLALEPGHGHHASRYDAAMRARNRLLADEEPLDTQWCAALEARMGEHGTVLAEARARAVTAINAALADAADHPFAKPLLAIESGDAADLAIDFSGRLAASRSRDRAAGRTLIGPHRADLAVTHAAKSQPAALCSTGEQKAMLLALILAHADIVAAKTGRRPILLLDEVAAHLDPVRRAALFDRLATAGGQVWMTGTEAALFADAGSASHFRVADAAIDRA